MQSNISKRVAAEKADAVDPTIGLMESEKDEIAQAIAIADAEKRIEEEALPEEVKDLILQEIKIDTFTTLRRYVSLTPSMCDVRGCGWDAAKEAGSKNWNSISVDTGMAPGQNFRQKLKDTHASHKSNTHP